MSDGSKTRVAVIGASGIGKHHAKWWTIEGADVCAFAGTSEASVAKAEEGLKGLFDFQGRGYTSIDEMIAQERPDIVDVCSPPSLHFDHTKVALEAGCHVLCEKPFVFDPAKSHESLMAEARELVDLSQRVGKRLGLCAQYVISARMIRNLWKRTRSDRVAKQYKVHLASPAKGRAPDPERVWIDLGPHPLSGLQVFSHDGEILWDTLRTEFEGYTARATFQARRTSGELIDCELITGNTTEGPPHIRQVSLEDYVVNIGGENDEDGIYCARFETPDGVYREPDFMRVLIAEFLAGAPSADTQIALTNLDWLLRILDHSRGKGGS
ncbi:MAG: Gfo/Idh/MocA family oxidoreductase [bacterium]|nr:Gfo/Idh/MocA family oxidoreductase [bacterium]